MKVASNGIELEVEITGDSDGEPLVMIMGIGTQLVHWPKGFCRRLADVGFRVILFDNRDIGLSSWLGHLGVPNAGLQFLRRAVGLKVRTPYTLWDMSDDTVGLIEALGYDSAHVLGISMGAMIAQCVAIKHPKRVRSLTSMHSTTGGRFVGKPHALRALFGPAPKNKEEAIQATRRVLDAIGSPGFSRDEARLAETAARAWDRGRNPPGFLRQFGAVLECGNREHLLRQLDVLALVIHGAEDPLIPPAAGRATAHAIPGARLAMIEGLGHDMPTDAWPIFTELIADHAL